MEGFIKLYRQLLDNPIWGSNEPFCRRAAWVDLLLMANHQDHTIWDNGETVEAKRGEVNRSIQYLADRWHWSRGKVTRFIHELETNGMCSIKRAGKRTAIFVENYSSWQDGRTGKRTQNGQLTDSRMTVDGQLTDTYKNGEERKECLRMMKNRMPVVPEERTIKEGDQKYHYINGVLQYSEDETREILQRAHEQFAPIKAAIMKGGRLHDHL